MFQDVSFQSCTKHIFINRCSSAFQISSFVSLTDRQEVLHGVFLLVAVPKQSILVGVVSVRAVPGNQAETWLRREQWSAVASLTSDVKQVVESVKFHMAEIKFSIEMITDIFEIDCSVLRINGWCVKEDASNRLTWSLCATTPPCCTTRHVSSAPPLGFHDASV